MEAIIQQLILSGLTRVEAIELLTPTLEDAFQAGVEYERESTPAIIGSSIGSSGEVDFYSWLNSQTSLLTINQTL